MEFKKIALEDVGVLKPYFNLTKDYLICDYTVGGTFMWRDYFNMEYAIEEGVLYSRLYNENGERFYNLPIGKPLGECLDKLKFQALIDGEHLRFCTVPESLLQSIKDLCECSYYEQEIFFDYLYSSQDLASLTGKKFSAQRNLISQFNRNNPNYTSERLDEKNLDEIKQFLNKKFPLEQSETDFEREENLKTFEALDYFNDFGYVGLVLKTDGEVVGFSLGEIIGDVLYYHIEKADKEVKGAYKKLCNLFVNEYAGKVKFVNREEDMGDAGLRKSKIDYNPIKILKKFVVEIK